MLQEMQRAGAAASLRFMAGSLRDQANLLMVHAETFEATARKYDAGELSLPLAPVRLTMAFDDPPGPEPEPEEGPVLPFSMESAWPAYMVDFVAQFDDRRRENEYFPRAIAEASEQGLPANDNSARLVAARMTELGEEAKTHGGN